MKRLFYILVLFAGFLTVSCLQDPEVENNIPDAPTVSYDDARMTRISALLNATYSGSLQDIKAVGFEIDGTIYEAEEHFDNKFSFVASTKPGQEYTVRSYFNNGKFSRYSSPIKLKAPMESAPSVTDVTYSNGVLSASILDDGGSSIVDVGFCIGTTDDASAIQTLPRYQAQKRQGLSFMLDFPVEGFGDYYVVAYAKNGNSKTPLGFSRNLLKVTRDTNDIVRIEDPVFEWYLVSNFDTNKDGSMSFAEIETITEILFRTDNLLSVKEINLMPLLTSLDVSGLARGYGQLSAIDVSANQQLNTLKVDYNTIKSIDVSCCPRLDTLSCAWNSLSEISVADNPKLVYLDCQGNSISQLDVSANNKLDYLDCSSTPLEYLYLNPTQTIKTLILPDGAKVIYLINNLSIEPASVTVNVGETTKLTPVFDPGNTVNKEVLWTSSDEEIATVSDEGIVSGIKSGKATITATFGLKSATCQVSVVIVPVTSISLDKPSLELIIGETATLQATTLPENATDKTVSWESSNTEIATVIDGNVTATGIGKCTITATSGDKVAECAITVLPIAVASITLEPTSYALPVGEKLTITPTILPDNATDKTIVWSTSNPEIATVADGVVTAINAGQCIITATSGNSSADCIVIVSEPIAGLTFNEESISIAAGESKPLTVQWTPPDAAYNISWSSSDESIATVSEDGVVTGVNFGTCNVIATIGELSAICQITIDGVLINSTSFPDAIFRTFIKRWDIDNDNYLSMDELAKVTSIVIEEKSIASLDGISYFFNLNILDCMRNQLTRLDISNLSRLSNVDCSFNLLSSLTLGDLPELTRLSCGSNQITALNLSGCPNLEDLGCGGNQITALDVSYCPNLKSLACAKNLLQTLNISDLTNLYQLSCDHNNLDVLNLENNSELIYFYCDHNQLTNIDVSNLSKLHAFGCDYNCLTSLTLGGIQEITILNCTNNLLTTLDVSKQPNIESISCENNKLSLITLGKKPKMWMFNCDKNQLCDIDVSGCTAMTTFYCGWNKLTSLHLDELTNLESLSCWWNQLTDLDLSQNLKMRNLACDDNKLTKLNINHLSNLERLQCNYNQLTTLNITNLKKLKLLHCWNNTLTTLDVSHNLELQDLSCDANELVSIDIRNLSKLKELYCPSNALTDLDVSNNRELQYLDCMGNHIASLDLSNLSKLKGLGCSGNPLTTIDVSNNLELSRFICGIIPDIVIWLRKGQNFEYFIYDQTATINYKD